jgi:glycine/D-amino acid oxidase-like deaminating enzyme
LWLETAPQLTTVGGPLRSHGPVDVVIVGAGYTGLSAARRLAQHGASVVVLERGLVGEGASSRNAGQVLTGLRLDASVLLARYGEVRAKAYFDGALRAIAHLEATVAEAGIACELQRSGHLVAACSRRHFAELEAEAALLARTFGHLVEIVGVRHQRREIGTDAYHGLLVDPRSLGLNPAQYLLGLARLAGQAGACIVTRTPAVHMVRNAAGWRVRTPAGEIASRELVFATDAASDRSAQALRRRLIPVGSYVIATEPLDAAVAASILPQARMAFDSRRLLHYFRLTSDRRLIFGGRATFRSPDRWRPDDIARQLHRDMAAVFPELRGTAVSHVWSGTVAFARDQLPRAGRLGEAWYAAGYAGHGIAMASYLGDRLARRMAGESIDDLFFDDRWPAIPLYTGRPWFLPVAGAYYRLRDAVDGLLTS